MSNENIKDDKFRDIFAGTKIHAGENLKYRIMQQIETEKALSPQKVKSSIPLIGNMLTVFGVMYALIAVIGIGIYMSEGKNVLESISFLLPVFLVILICSIFWMISVYDDRRRSRQH